MNLYLNELQKEQTMAKASIKKETKTKAKIIENRKTEPMKLKICFFKLTNP